MLENNEKGSAAAETWGNVCQNVEMRENMLKMLKQMQTKQEQQYSIIL